MNFCSFPVLNEWNFSFQAEIRKELNEFKEFEMEVHEESKCYTRYVQEPFPESTLNPLLITQPHLYKVKKSQL